MMTPNSPWEEDLEVEHLKKPKKKKIAKVVTPPKTIITKPDDTSTAEVKPKPEKKKAVKSKRGRIIKNCYKSDGRGRTSKMQESWFKRVGKNPRKPTNQPGYDVWENLEEAEQLGGGRFSYYDFVLLGGKLTDLRYDIRVERIKVFEKPAPAKQVKK